MLKTQNVSTQVDNPPTFIPNSNVLENRPHPYRPISEFYKNKFQQKVYKIPVTTILDCPNRRGLKGMKTCIFCDPWGSAAHKESLHQTLQEQIELHWRRMAKRYNATGFLIYFQAYTNTFSKLVEMRSHFEISLSYPFVKGLVVGTRPDCLSKALFDLWSEYSQKTYVTVELGVQSFNDKILEFLQRGHTRRQAIHAIEKIKQLTPIDIGVHLIFGNPYESDRDILEAAKIINDLGIHNVKLHNLHVLKGTGLEELYLKGKFYPITFEEYARRVCLFLEHLSPKIYVHRLAALSSRAEELIEPKWVAYKMETHQKLLDFMKAQNSFQGKAFELQTTALSSKS
ncbi:MAG: TIGR01212 family radical SAM protein [Bdellovibrionaceae bacterium]|nr:TIGR01212 family radical SAM protein [Pseudobdellovibrionaceae bacterium]MDW8189912.1 TIGR01212 family radical SAM protein [Pseudobdellovibrionaceae bacterium]